MNWNRLWLSAALSHGLAMGAMACNLIVGNDSVSLWSGDDGAASDGAFGETGADASVDAKGGDATVDALMAEGSVDTSLDADSAAVVMFDATPDAIPDATSDAVAESGACTGAGSTPSCTCVSSICTKVGTVCQDGQTRATCAVDGNGCPYVASTSMCPSPQSCSGTAPSAACSLTCTNSCTSGQTSCVSGSLAKCTLGSNGCWAYGTPAACGAHQSCTGTAGSSACTCKADPVCSAAGKVCTSTSASATCTADSQGCIYESGSSMCTNQTCVSGVCTGVCGPGQKQCLYNGVQTCASGAWGSAVACPASTPMCSAGSCGAPLSCQTSGAGLTNCGASSESCCTSLEVPGGTYYRTYTNTGSGPTGEADPATVSGFRLDKYDVTVGRFRRFVTAWNNGSGYLPPASSGKHTHLNGGQGLVNNGADAGPTHETGWQTSYNTNVHPTDDDLTTGSQGTDPAATWTPSAGSNENLPINCVSWWEAYAFCIWDGGFLPSEAEWENAAAGGSQQRAYPWGATAPGTTNQYAIYGDMSGDCYYPSGSLVACTDFSNIAPVGTAKLGAGLWGQLDLAGEMFQWGIDILNDTNSHTDPCVDCAYLTAVGSDPVWVITGGGYFNSASTLSPSASSGTDGTEANDNIGFRCARSP